MSDFEMKIHNVMEFELRILVWSVFEFKFSKRNTFLLKFFSSQVLKNCFLEIKFWKEKLYENQILGLKFFKNNQIWT